MTSIASRRRPLAAFTAVLLITIGFVVSQTASASSRAPRSLCDGVHLVQLPYIVIGIGPIVIDISGPLNDLIHCQPINLGRSSQPTRAVRAGSCANARTTADQLKPRLAAKATRCLIDQERRRRGLGGLSAEGTLKEAALKHTNYMLATGCFAHVCPGEPELSDRATSAGYLPCNCYWSVGENIAWGRGVDSSPAAIVAAWMASPPHRELILNGSMEDINIGVRLGKPGDRRATAATYTADFGYLN